jgi:hypothetical protein
MSPKPFYKLRRIDLLLGNGSVSTFPRKCKCATIVRPLLGNGSVNKLFER